ncbi:MAG: deaminase [Candidatus Portnoybacteria bacterium]|nr:deaminase [Candidatus Portnoybacteria bacterium]
MLKIEYPYIPEGREIFYVEENNKFMTLAMRIRNTESTDELQPTGAVVVKDGIILGSGANQVGFKNHFLIKLHAKGWCIRKRIHIKSGTKYWLCPGCATHKEHAENRAVRDAVKKSGLDAVRGSDLYLFGHWWCCKPCWDKIIEAEIKNVYLLSGSWQLFNHYSKRVDA